MVQPLRFYVTLANRDRPRTLSKIGEKQSSWPSASKRENRVADTRVHLFLSSSLDARRASGSILGKCIGSHTIKEADTFFDALSGGTYV